MAIAFSCTCGKPLRAQDSAAGKRTKCPHCGAVMVIPGGAVKPVVASASMSQSAGAAADDDGLALDLDWNTLEAPAATSSQTAADPHRTGSSQIAISTAAVEIPFLPEGVRQYRVLAQKDQGMTSKFTASKLEEVLNAYAIQGWSLKSAVTMNLPSHSGNHDELIVILER
jgi:Domain of unknown function (DUF4177)